MSGSKLFRRNRALGYVTNQIPASVRYFRNRQENIIITCIGRAFHTYSSSHFRLICVSGLHPEDISCLSSDSRYVYTASGETVYAWRSGNVIKHRFVGHQKSVHLLMPFGGAHLMSIDTNSTVKVWNIDTEEEYCELPFKNNEFKISAVLHPPTYLNKVLFGSEQGSLQLWNIKECKLVYTFKPFHSEITVLEAAPAVDVCAIGLIDGGIILLNLKYDEYVMEFKQDWGPVTGLSFRTDGHPIMVSSSTNGRVVVWNLEERQIASQFIAHDGSITTTFCFVNEPLLFTTSPDNSMKLWIFDLPDGGARLLRIREGHAEPPQYIRYHGHDGKSILSAGEDSSLRIFSTVSETLNKSMGKASYNRKASKKKNRFVEDPHRMPPITEFTSECTREKEWDNIAAIHGGLITTTTWSFHKCKMGDLKLVPEQFQNKNRTDFTSEATCICLTHCGNFVIIGYSSGDVERFNIQSGIHRARYGVNEPAHRHAVRGVHCDTLNQMVISGDNEGSLKFWHFSTPNIKQPYARLTLPEGISMFRAHRENAMLCIALDDYTLNIMDCETRSIVRKFSGHTAHITDVCFSPDSRWLVSASMDCTIKVFHIPSAYMVDHFSVDMACVSLTMSPTGDFLATTHVNYLGIYLWANKALFSYVSLKSIDPYSVAPIVDLPSSVITGEDNVDLEFEDLAEGESIELNYKSPQQLNKSLVTMSDVAASRWQNLLNLDIVKQRNRPKVPLKVPKHAPFFLPTIAGLDFQFDTQAELNGTSGESSKLLFAHNFSNLTSFGKCLDESRSTDKFGKCVKHITALGPSMVDFEIKSLHPDGGGNLAVMEQFIKMILFMFESNRNFELAQGYLAVFLKAHSRLLVDEPQLSSYLVTLQTAQQSGWKTLEQKLMYGIGVASALRIHAN